MEDSHIACTDLGDNTSVFGVFDGHGGKNICIMSFKIGKEVALYVKEKFVDELKKLNSFKQKDYSTALREVFIKIDEMLVSPAGQKEILKF